MATLNKSLTKTAFKWGSSVIDRCTEINASLPGGMRINADNATKCYWRHGALPAGISIKEAIDLMLVTADALIWQSDISEWSIGTSPAAISVGSDYVDIKTGIDEESAMTRLKVINKSDAEPVEKEWLLVSPQIDEVLAREQTVEVNRYVNDLDQIKTTYVRRNALSGDGLYANWIERVSEVTFDRIPGVGSTVKRIPGVGHIMLLQAPSGREQDSYYIYKARYFFAPDRTETTFYLSAI